MQRQLTLSPIYLLIGLASSTRMPVVFKLTNIRRRVLVVLLLVMLLLVIMRL